jgi:hypothetical protein
MAILYRDTLRVRAKPYAGSKARLYEAGEPNPSRSSPISGRALGVRRPEMEG